MTESEYKSKLAELEALYDQWLEKHRSGTFQEVLAADSALGVLDRKITKLHNEWASQNAKTEAK